MDTPTSTDTEPSPLRDYWDAVFTVIAWADKHGLTVTVEQPSLPLDQAA